MKVIVFEGIDSSGKSSCIHVLKKYYEEKDKKVKIIELVDILKTTLDRKELLEENDHVKFFLNLALLQSIEQKIYKLKNENEVDILLVERFYDHIFTQSKFLKLNKSKKKFYTKLLYKYYYASYKPDAIIYCTASIPTIIERLEGKGPHKRSYDLKFNNKLLLERAEREEGIIKKIILMCNTDVESLLQKLVSELKILEENDVNSKKE